MSSALYKSATRSFIIVANQAELAVMRLFNTFPAGKS